MSKHFPPLFNAEEFHCPYCGVYAAQFWEAAARASGRTGGIQYRGTVDDIDFCHCAHCGEYSVWYKKHMVLPNTGASAPPHEDMPANVKSDYEEASRIVTTSPRGAAALLRLAIQKLMPHLGEKGKDLNTDIGNLVKKGLHVQVQQACDAVRVIGNEAVHPGELNLNDTPETAHALFELLNVIVDVMISQPKRIQELYSSLPAGKLQQIQNRDATS